MNNVCECCGFPDLGINDKRSHVTCKWILEHYVSKYKIREEIKKLEASLDDSPIYVNTNRKQAKIQALKELLEK